MLVEIYVLEVVDELHDGVTAKALAVAEEVDQA